MRQTLALFTFMRNPLSTMWSRGTDLPEGEKSDNESDQTSDHPEVTYECEIDTSYGKLIGPKYYNEGLRVGSLSKDSATINHARNAWASTDVVAGEALNPVYDVHPLDTLAEDDIASIAPCTGVGGDEELGQGETSEG